MNCRRDNYSSFHARNSAGPKGTEKTVKGVVPQHGELSRHKAMEEVQENKRKLQEKKKRNNGEDMLGRDVSSTRSWRTGFGIMAVCHIFASI